MERSVIELVIICISRRGIRRKNSRAESIEHYVNSSPTTDCVF